MMVDIARRPAVCDRQSFEGMPNLDLAHLPRPHGRVVRNQGEHLGCERCGERLVGFGGCLQKRELGQE